MDTLSQSTNCPFKPHKAKELALVSKKNQKKRPKRKNRRKKKKGRKFGKELQNRGDLVYVRKDDNKKDCSTAETDKSLNNTEVTCKVGFKKKNPFSKKNPAISEIFVQKGTRKIIEAKKADIKINTISLSKKDELINSNFNQKSNPQNVEVYRERITKYLLKKDSSRKISTTFLLQQTNISEKMRGILVDWLVDVTFKFRLLDETLFSAIWIMDRFLSKGDSMAKDQLQLLGVSCLMISAKMEEVYPPSLKDYLQVCDGAYSEIQILDKEATILSVLNFDIAVATSLHMFKFFTRNLSITQKSYFFGEYLLHSALLDIKSFKFSQNELSAGAIFLVNKMFKGSIKWSRDVSNLSGVNEDRVKVVAKELYKILKRVGDKDWAAVRRKFSRVEAMEVAKFKVERVSKQKKK